MIAPSGNCLELLVSLPGEGWSVYIRPGRRGWAGLKVSILDGFELWWVKTLIKLNIGTLKITPTGNWGYAGTNRWREIVYTEVFPDLAALYRYPAGLQVHPGDINTLARRDRMR